jgi:hypothetical protein
MHLIRKGQVHGVEKGNVVGQISFIAHLFGVAASAEREVRLRAPRVSSCVFATQPYHLPQTPGILGRLSSAKEKISVFYLAMAGILVTNVMIKNTKPAKRGMITFESSILFGRVLIALAAPR